MTLGKLGDTLRTRREDLGLSLEEAQEATKIRGKLLAALETGAYDLLPDPGYVRGYISSYARFLELDPHPLLNMYKAETGTARTSLDLPQAGAPAVAPTGQQHAFSLRAGIITASVIAALALAVWIAVAVFSEPDLDTTNPPLIETTQTAPSTEKTEPANTEPEVQTPPPVTPTVKPFTLTIRISSEAASWLRVTVDGKPAYEGTLAAGQKKVYEVAEAATVRVGKPEAVTVLKDGKPVKLKTVDDIASVTIKAVEEE